MLILNFNLLGIDLLRSWRLAILCSIQRRIYFLAYSTQFLTLISAYNLWWAGISCWSDTFIYFFSPTIIISDNQLWYIILFRWISPFGSQLIWCSSYLGIGGLIRLLWRGSFIQSCRLLLVLNLRLSDYRLSGFCRLDIRFESCAGSRIRNCFAHILIYV